LRDTHPDQFGLREPAEPGVHFLDLLAGGSGLREALLGENSPERLLEDWREQSKRFLAQRNDFLIYG
jgi:uncharacterized protein YbbC (DUF1343 family)